MGFVQAQRFAVILRIQVSVRLNNAIERIDDRNTLHCISPNETDMGGSFCERLFQRLVNEGKRRRMVVLIRPTNFRLIDSTLDKLSLISICGCN